MVFFGWYGMAWHGILMEAWGEAAASVMPRRVALVACGSATVMVFANATGRGL
jgi:hypothetical protein